MAARDPMTAAMTRAGAVMTVLFADICGSTRLYTTLGDATARVLVAHGLEIVASVLPRFAGRLVKTIGDEAMCVFADPDAAVLAAIEMQARMRSGNPAARKLAIHIGLQHGPVLLEGDDVFGDTVNAASYLCAVARPGQILTADSTVQCLSISARNRTRKLFFAVIKGAESESALYQVLEESETGELTDVNARQHNLLPPDSGSLAVLYGERVLRIDPRHPRVVLGRDGECGIQIADPFASRRHATLSLRHTQVFLCDHSTNGTFVRRADGEIAHVFRAELLLEGSGQISLGRAFDQNALQSIVYRRDRRALYRV